MATASATLSSATFVAATSSVSIKKSKNNVHYIAGLNAYGGLKAMNGLVSLGHPITAQESFAKIVCSLNSPSSRKGGLFSAKCSAAAEIFRIAAVMNGLVLVGVAVGFVLLGIEASVEEAE